MPIRNSKNKEKKIDYKQVCTYSTKKIKEILRIAGLFSEFEFSEPIHAELEEILDLCNKYVNNNSKSDTVSYKELYYDIINDIAQIDDDFREIDMLSGELISQINQLPEQQKKFIYSHLGTSEIPREFEGLSEELKDELFNALDITEKLLDDSAKYFSSSDEDELLDYYEQ